MKPRILVVCPNYLDGTSFYRCAGPLTQLQKESKVELIFDDTGAWPTLKLADIVFFQRPQEKAHLDLLKKALSANIPVWADYDDLLSAVPDSNPNKNKYWDPDTQMVIWAFLQNVDILSVSTEFLKDCYKSATRQEPIVIPNAWDDHMYPKKFDATNTGVVWRGSCTHDEDLYSQKTNLEMLDNNLDVNWHFVGDPFWLALRGLKQLTTYPWKDLTTFQNNLERISATVAIVPLADNSFNKAKSNIAWIEATRVGAAVVAPNWAEWQMPGITTYSNDAEFYMYVKLLYEDPDFAKAQNKLSWEDIQANLRLTKVNKLRMDLINKLRRK